jgi:hypothetical protein
VRTIPRVGRHTLDTRNSLILTYEAVDNPCPLVNYFQDVLQNKGHRESVASSCYEAGPHGQISG